MTDLKDLDIRKFRLTDEEKVIRLWHECGLLVPWNNPHSDIERKVADSPELFFIAERQGALLGTCMAGYDGHRGWLYYLAVSKKHQKQGIAGQLVDHAESVLRALGCPKLEVMARESNQEVSAFYEGKDYRKEPVVVLSKRLIEDNPHFYND